MKIDPFDLAAGTTEFYLDTTYYDHEFRQRRVDVVWYTEQYLEEKGPVLEIGVGTGRTALPAVRKGAEVVGIDLSPTMLAQAEVRRSRLARGKQAKLTLIEADMRNFDLGRKFGLISCPFNAFQHLYTHEDIERCLACVRDHLEPDGLFIFDVLMPDLEYFLRSPFKTYPGIEFKHPTHGVRYTYSERSAYDHVQQINQMWFQYDRIPGEPAKGPESYVVQLSHRCFFPEELLGLLHYNGFEVLSRLGDFEAGPLTPNCESMVLMCGLREPGT